MNSKIVIIGFLVFLVLVSGCIKINLDQKIDQTGIMESHIIIDMSQLAENFPTGEGAVTTTEDLCSQQRADFEGRGNIISFECTTTDDFNSVITVREQLPANIFSKEETPFSTKYTYNLSEYQKLSEQGRSQAPIDPDALAPPDGQPSSIGEINDEMVSSLALAGFEITYNIQMPGTITSTTVGEIKNNKVVISLVEMGKLNDPNISNVVVSEEINLLVPIIGGTILLMVLVIGGILVYFFVIKKNVVVPPVQQQPLRPLQPLLRQTTQEQNQQPVSPQQPKQQSTFTQPAQPKVQPSAEPSNPLQERPLQTLKPRQPVSKEPQEIEEPKPRIRLMPESQAAPKIQPIQTEKESSIFSFPKKAVEVQKPVEEQKPVAPQETLEQKPVAPPKLQSEQKTVPEDPIVFETPPQPKEPLSQQKDPISQPKEPLVQQKKPSLAILSAEEEKDVKNLLSVLASEKQKYSREEIIQVIKEKGYGQGVLTEVLKRLFE